MTDKQKEEYEKILKIIEKGPRNWSSMRRESEMHPEQFQRKLTGLQFLGKAYKKGDKYIKGDEGSFFFKLVPEIIHRANERDLERRKGRDVSFLYDFKKDGTLKVPAVSIYGLPIEKLTQTDEKKLIEQVKKIEGAKKEIDRISKRKGGKRTSIFSGGLDPRKAIEYRLAF